MTPLPTPEARRAFEEASGELAILLRGGDDGFVAEMVVASSRKGIEPYRLLRSLGGYWMHADTRCEGFLQRNECRHIDAAEARENKMAENGQEIVVYTNPLALAQHVSVEDVINDFTAVGEWRYAFRQQGKEIEGLSADGVQDGVRQMARRGEAIRTLEVHLERETDNEAFFIARAARFAIAPDGREIMLDSTLRGKRVSKWETHNSDDQYGKWKKGDRYPVEAWFENGVTKASRNAEEALMPEALKQWMLKAAKGAPSGQQAPTRSQAPRRPAPPNVDGDTGEIHDAQPSAPPEPTDMADEATWRHVQALMAAAPQPIKTKAVRDVPGVQAPARMTLAQALDAIAFFDGEGVTVQAAMPV